MLARILRRAVMPLLGLGLVPGPLLAVEPARPDDSPILLHVENAGFTSSLRAWVADPHTTGVAGAWAADGFAPSAPGSVWLSNSGLGVGSSILFQCIPNVLPDRTYFATVKVFAPAGQPLSEDGAIARLDLIGFAGSACDGTSSHDFLEPSEIRLGPSGSGGWQELRYTFDGLPATRSLGIQLVCARREGQPDGTVGAYFDEVTLDGPSAFVKGDMDGGGETDLVLRNTVTNEHRVWYLNDEARALDLPLRPQPGTDWKTAGVDDFDHDGHNDLLMWNAAAGWLDFWIMDGTRRVGESIPIAPSDPGPSWKPSASADFNRDGKADIVLRNPATQAVKIWLMNGMDHVADLLPTPDHAADANWEIVGAADMNRDGFTDILWYNATSGRIVFWVMDDNVVRLIGAFTTPMSAGDANWKVVAMGDYGIGPSTDGVGRAKTQDIVWRNDTSGRAVVWYMDIAGRRTGGAFVTPDPPAPATDWTVVGPR